MKTIYVIRHADAGREDGVKYCLGSRLDWPLSPKGLEQAKVLRQKLSAVSWDAVYTSPLARANQTGRILAGNCVPVTVLPDLIEMDAGAWEGLPVQTIRERYGDLWSRRRTDMSLPPPDGETCEVASQRAMRALHHVLEALPEGGTAAMVAHGSINRTLLCQATGIPFSQGNEVTQDHTGFAVLEAHEGKITLVRMEGKLDRNRKNRV